MNLSAIDYLKLYKIQDQVFLAISQVLEGFYLTGGTALGRFYLDHRYSEDLDFFINADTDFSSRANRIYLKLKSSFTIDDELSLMANDYARFYLTGEYSLKIDLVNDVPEHWGAFAHINGIKLDNPANILSNKLCAIMNRDEPKDIFDIVSIACSYSFNWRDVYHQAGK